MKKLFLAILVCCVPSARAWDPNKPFIYEMRIAMEADNWFNFYSTATVLSKSDNSVAFRVVANSTTTAVYQLVVTTQGNVGISTGNPQARLEVQGSSASAYSLAVGTSAAYQFVVSTGGNVGIGTASPSSRLEVNGDISLTQPDALLLSHFVAIKATAGGTASTQVLYKIDPSGTDFAEGIIELTYGTRLQYLSDAVTGVVKKLFGYNKFNGDQIAVTQTTILQEDSNSAAYAPIAAVVVGSGASAYVALQVSFSSSIGPSSFVWGEVHFSNTGDKVAITKLVQ